MQKKKKVTLLKKINEKKNENIEKINEVEIENIENFEQKNCNLLFKYSISKNCWNLIYFNNSCNLNSISNHNCCCIENNMYYFDGNLKFKNKLDLIKSTGGGLYLFKNISNNEKDSNFILYLESLFETSQFFDLILKSSDEENVIFFFFQINF
jgi:hypothetical protein